MLVFSHVLFKILLIFTLHKVKFILFDIQFYEFLQMPWLGDCKQDTEQVYHTSKNSLWSQPLPTWQPLIFSVSTFAFSSFPGLP